MRAMRFEGVHDGRRSGITPLRMAVIANRLDLVNELLHAGADVEAPLAQGFPQFEMLRGMTVLHTACWICDDASIVRALLAHGAKPTAKEKNGGSTPLQWACGAGK